MQVEALIERLRANASVFAALVEGVDERQARWKPAPDQWSILEVVNHLADEEGGDFRTRLDLTLHRHDADWPPIDPPGWVSERRYNERRLDESIERFLRERRESVAWLGGLEHPDWARAHRHPRLGPISAGELLTSWLGHDQIHVRQINRLHRQYLEGVLSEHSARYAGPW